MYSIFFLVFLFFFPFVIIFTDWFLLAKSYFNAITLSKVINKKWIILELKSRANRTKRPKDIPDYKKQRNLLVRLNRERRIEYFENL